MVAPKLNKMTFDDLLDQMCVRARDSIEDWNIPKEEPGMWPNTDPGLALLKIFAHMHEEVITRLNRVLDKNFSAFLDTIGINLLPAKPARVPVTFYPVDGSPDSIYVAAGTPVATSETEYHPALTYQTSKSFSACDAPLIGIYSIDPLMDKIYDHLPDLTAERPFQPFCGNNLQEHMLFLGHSELFKVGGSTDIKLLFKFASAPDMDMFSDLIWEYNKENSAVNPMQIEGSKIIWAQDLRDPNNQTFILTLKEIGRIKETELNGISSLWISCRQNEGFLPLIKYIKIVGLDFSNRIVKPDYAFYKFIPLDLRVKSSATLELERSIYPFGKNPRLFDTFCIANGEVFSKAGSEIRINVELENPVADDVTPALTWEYFNGNAWLILSPEAYNNSNQPDVKVANLKASGYIRFNLPSDIQQCEVNGVENHWIRATIMDGDYGHESFQRKADDSYELTNNFSPPCLKKITIALSNSNINDSDKSVSLEHCLACNNLSHVDLTERAKGSDVTGFNPFLPLPGTGTDKTIFLGFKNPFLDGNISLFFYVDESKIAFPRPSLVWSYWGGDIKLEEIGAHSSGMTLLKLQFSEGFGPATELMIQEAIIDANTGNPSVAMENALIDSVLDDGSMVLNRRLTHPFTKNATVARRIYLPCQDNTENLGESDTLDFISPGNQNKTLLFGKEGYWLMCSLEGTGEVPILLGVYPNTVWAEQVETVTDEILGSSDGGAKMTFSLQNKPAVSCEIWILEGIVFSEDDKAELAKEISLQEMMDDSGVVVDTWVKWAEVDDLLQSDSRSRQYTLDHALGRVSFGDGKMGMIPPIGGSNIKANYTWGGAVAGNVSAREINTLKVALAGIDRVTNCQPAQGGSDTEAISSALERGPHSIKHRNRAVTKEDYERLAKESSSYVARTRCMASGANNLNLIVIPKGTDDRPTPSTELLDDVKKYLLERSLCSMSPDSLCVIPPSYRDIRIGVEICPTSIDLAAPLGREIIKRLKAYLHPLTGGAHGTGWDFGRSIYRSDLYSLLEGISGVDHVGNLTINDIASDFALKTEEIACSGNHNVKIILED